MNNMPLGGLHEQDANYAIAEWLQTRGEWEAHGERVGVMRGNRQRPDIVLTQRGRMPVIVENEYGKPAAGDAKSRRGVSWTSQSLLVAKTAQEHHGGRAWNALQGFDDETGACVALFFNSVFGAFAMRAYGKSPQQGPRASVQVGAIPGLPCPNFSADSDAARRARSIAAARFDELSRLELQAFPYCFQDEARQMIDNAAAEMLGLNTADPEVQAMLAHYRRLFASEPDVNGGQKKILAGLEAAFGGQAQRQRRINPDPPPSRRLIP